MALVDAAVLCCLVAMFGNTCEPDVVQGLDLHLFVFFTWEEYEAHVASSLRADVKIL